MRISTAALAAFGLAIALPVIAATGAISDATKANAGITPDSPLSFIDKTFDALAIAVAFSPEAKVDASLKVAEERAAEAAVMSAAGNTDLAAKSAEAAASDVSIAVKAASGVANNELAAPLVVKIEEATVGMQATLQEGIDVAPADAKADVQEAVNPSMALMTEASKAVTVVAAPKPAGTVACDQTKFDACVRTNGCTEDTSATCFKACPPKVVTCDDPKAGKTCKQPDTACVNQCLSKLLGCFDTCLSTANCKKEEVKTNALKLISPEELQRVFQNELKAGAMVK